MAILRIGAFGKSYVVPAAFENEQEIERLLAENPQLLVADGATPPVLVTEHLILPDCKLGLLLLDVTSVPIVVESRVAKSEDCRHDVVAHAIDCISALAPLTVAQLDDAAGGAVERALRTFAGDDRDDFGRRWTSLAANLRAARVRFIVAVDALGPSTDRKIRFLAEHSNLDVQCVAIAKSREANGDTYYTPTSILGAVTPPPHPFASPNIRPPESQAVLDSVDRVPSPRAIRLVGSAANSRRTPASARHVSAPYEFMKREGTLPVDLERVQWDG